MFSNPQGILRHRTRARHERPEAGFTLVELLVVIVILGILSAVVVFSVRGINDKGQSAACRTDKATIQTAEEAFYASGRNRYATMAELESAGFLSAVSTLYDAKPSGSSYTVTPLPATDTTPASPCS
ncbi:type IV pilin protein [Kitasatospora sp. NPDC096147]|uniref:type IV pilin protein n=1 Tax=Kitasatospora sp. NPDC096147 TaxID=3364093 RepID=UPI0037F47C8B